jgi:hypothetical protein
MNYRSSDDDPFIFDFELRIQGSVEVLVHVLVEKRLSLAKPQSTQMNGIG